MLTLCKKYDELYEMLSEVLQDNYYFDTAIVSEISTGIRGTLSGTIDSSYLPFFEHVTDKKRKYDGGFTATELLDFVRKCIANSNTSFSLVEGLEAPLSLTVMYMIRGNLESIEYFFARDKWEANDNTQCESGYLSGIGFNGKSFQILKYNVSTHKTTKRLYKPVESGTSEDSFQIVNGVLKKYKGREKKVVIPGSVTTIGKKAFMNKDEIEEVIISDSVKVIDDEAFMFCYNLKSVTIPGSVTTLGKNAFRDCSALIDLVIPDSVEIIGCYALYGTPIGWKMKRKRNK